MVQLKRKLSIDLACDFLHQLDLGGIDRQHRHPPSQLGEFCRLPFGATRAQDVARVNVGLRNWLAERCLEAIATEKPDGSLAALAAFVERADR